MKNKLQLFSAIVLLTFLTSCAELNNTLSLKKKQRTEEFLVKKKKPLVIPPKFDELPMPIDEEENQVSNQEEKIDISKVLNNKQGSENTDLKSSKDLEKSISNILNSK